MDYFKIYALAYLSLIVSVVQGIYIPCVAFNQNCSYSPCCEPYVCYEQTVCIGMNETKI